MKIERWREVLCQAGVACRWLEDFAPGENTIGFDDFKERKLIWYKLAHHRWLEELGKIPRVEHRWEVAQAKMDQLPWCSRLTKVFARELQDCNYRLSGDSKGYEKTDAGYMLRHIESQRLHSRNPVLEKIYKRLGTRSEIEAKAA